MAHWPFLSKRDWRITPPHNIQTFINWQISNETFKSEVAISLWHQILKENGQEKEYMYQLEGRITHRVIKAVKVFRSQLR